MPANKDKKEKTKRWHFSSAECLLYFAVAIEQIEKKYMSTNSANNKVIKIYFPPLNVPTTEST